MPKIDVQSDTGPFAILPEWVLDQKISPTAIRLYCVLATMADRKTRTSFSSRAYLAKRCQCSVRHIARALIELKEVGALWVEHRWKEDDSGEATKELDTNLYTVIRQIPGMSLPSDTRVLTPKDTGVLDNQRVSEPDSSEDPSEEGSSSSAEEEEDFLNRVASFYSSRLPASPHFVSSVRAPGPYFQTLRQNGSLPVSDLDACWEFAEEIHAAVNVGYPDHKIVTFPGPASLPGLAACLEPVQRYSLPAKFLRLALYEFCGHDGVDPPELSGSDVLERIGKRPDLFAEALRQQSESLG
jgi:hypothetical protein